jgi:hypothetical protein
VFDIRSFKVSFDYATCTQFARNILVSDSTEGEHDVRCSARLSIVKYLVLFDSEGPGACVLREGPRFGNARSKGTAFGGAKQWLEYVSENRQAVRVVAGDVWI